MRGRSGGEAFGRTPRLPSLLAVLLLLPLLPMVSAQEPPPEHQVTVIGSSMSLFQEPGLETMIENDQVDTDCTGARTLTRDLVNRTFTFRDPFQDTDCTEAQFVMRIPVGATSLVVNFTADRQIGQAESAVPGVQGLPLVPNMVEQFRLRGPDGVIGFADLFDKQDAPSPPVTFTLEYSFPLGLQTVTLGWFFKDEGATFQEQPLRAGQVFNATVTNMTVTWPALPLLEPTILVGPEEIREEDRVAVAHVYTNVTLPDLAPLIVGKTAGLRLTVAAGPDLVGLLGPRGPMDVEGLSSVEGGRRLELSLNGTVLAEQGFGTYTFDFLTARTLAPLPPVSAPSRVYPMFWALLLLPIPAAVLATYSSNAYRREAEGPYLRTARAVLGAIVAIVVYYVAIALYALISIGQREMATVPPTNEVLLLYSQLLMVLLLLVAIAILQARSRTGAMRRDIEERRRKEDRLRRSNEELERFAYVASHDLQEPLRKVAGFTALLQKRYAGRLDRDADEIIQYAVDGASRMQMLIKDILAYSRVGSKELNRVPVDANATMDLVAADLGAPIEQTKASVTWDALPTVRADASQLRQVLQNLVENAIKYRHPKRRPKVHVSAASDGGMWHFTVGDNGQGIPADKHEEIFGIFRRLHGQSTPGTGIGLAVAKKAMERHDGRIWVESTPGKGSTFHFTLPRSLLDGNSPLPTAAPLPEGSSAGAAV